MAMPSVPITPIGRTTPTLTMKTFQGSAESFTSSYNSVTDIVTITESDGTLHEGGPVKVNPSFALQFTSKNGNIYQVKANDVT